MSQVFPDLLREWYATGAMEDTEDAVEGCDVCGHENIRYLFTIQNHLNQNVREKSGSKCILKFQEIGVQVGSRITYDQEEKEQALTAIIERHKKAQRTRLRRELADQILVGLADKVPGRAPLDMMRSIALKVKFSRLLKK